MSQASDTSRVDVPDVRPEGVTESFVNYFSTARLQRNVLIIVGLLLVNKLGTPGNLVFYAILFAWALRSPVGAVKAVSMSGLLITASDFLVSRGGFVGPGKYLLLFVAGLTLLRTTRNPVGQSFQVFLLIFAAVAAALSVYNGYMVSVSLLKLGSFLFGSYCLLNIVNQQRNVGLELTEWALSLIIAIVLLSYGALVIGVGYGTVIDLWGGRFTGYRGVFSHPQTMGVMAGIMCVYLAALLMFVDFPRRKLVGWLLALTFVLVYLSNARTGLLGFVLASCITLVLVGLGRNPPTERRLLRRVQKQFFTLVAIGLVAAAAVEITTGRISDNVTEFLMKPKAENYEFSLSGIYSARADQIERAWNNFKDTPWTGIGFGTDVDPMWRRKATLLSASTEKGFLPTALLEEVGIIGASGFVLFLLSFYAFLIRTRRYLCLATFTALLVVNLGEMMFFAFGGMATLCWAFVAMAASAGQAQIHQPYGWRR